MYKFLLTLVEGLVLIVCMFVKMAMFVPFFMISATVIIIISAIEAAFKGTSVVDGADMRLETVLDAFGIELRFQ